MYLIILEPVREKNLKCGPAQLNLFKHRSDGSILFERWQIWLYAIGFIFLIWILKGFIVKTILTLQIYTQKEE